MPSSPQNARITNASPSYYLRPRTARTIRSPDIPKHNSPKLRDPKPRQPVASSSTLLGDPAPTPAPFSTSIVVIPQRVSARDDVTSRIGALLESVIDGLIKGEEALFLPYRSRTAAALESRAGRAVSDPARHSEGVRFPGKTIPESKKFAALLSILEVSYEALTSNNIITKRFEFLNLCLLTEGDACSVSPPRALCRQCLTQPRNIYYQNKDLFGHQQRTLDHMIDNLAFTLGVGRDDLNIVAAAKGLMSGPIELIMRDGCKINCGFAMEGTLLPPIQSVEMCHFHSATWMLIIEKEATFRTLVHSRYHSKSKAGHGILVTAKGFPDLATRAFLNAIQSIRPQLAIFALVDFDPYGIAILRTYKYGSQSLAHEENITVPHLRWLGVRSTDTLAQTSAPSEDSSQSTASQSSRNTAGSSQDSLAFSQAESNIERPSKRVRITRANKPYESALALTLKDRKRALDVMKEIVSKGAINTEEHEQMTELQRMLMLGIKAEMQAVDNLGDITEWLDRKLYMNMNT